MSGESNPLPLLFHESLHTETTLFQRIAEGDEQAYKLVYDRYWHTTYQAALSVLKSPQQAEDIVQQVFTKLWEKRDKLKTVENPEAFLFIMSRNCIFDGMRERARLEKLKNRLTDPVPENYLSPESQLAYREMAAFVNRVVATLPSQQQLVFKLSREQGLSYAEIAQQLAIAPATVKSHLIRALNAIRQSLAKRDADPLLLAFFLLPLAGS